MHLLYTFVPFVLLARLISIKLKSSANARVPNQSLYGIMIWCVIRVTLCSCAYHKLVRCVSAFVFGSHLKFKI